MSLAILIISDYDYSQKRIQRQVFLDKFGIKREIVFSFTNT